MNNTRPNRLARIAGALYLAIFAIAPVAFIVGKDALVVDGDAEATAARIVESEATFRIGMAAAGVVVLVEIVLAAVLYILFHSVSAPVSLAAAFARLGEAVVQAVNLMTGILAITALGGAGYLSTIGEDQRNALALLFLDANGFVVFVWGLLFGMHLALLGWLVYRSGFLPRLVGVLLMIASLGYLAEGFGNILAPASTGPLSGLVIVLAVPGELAFAGWLLVRGVNERAWRAGMTPGDHGYAARPLPAP